MSSETLFKLDIESALAAEASTERNLVPPEPGWDILTDSNPKIKAIAKHVGNICLSGFEPTDEKELSAFKPGHGIRPVAYWGPVERIVYRALATAAVRDLPPLDRSGSEYVKFVKAPLTYSGHLQKTNSPRNNPPSLTSFFRILDSEIKYVVKSDLTAFYQHIDHALLAEELLAQGADYNIVTHLLELLVDVTGRPTGLPQLYDASDMLSEIYVDKLERALLRAGLAVWRFNDDFRIACRNYSESINGIETLDSLARQMGLTINESKTFTYQFFNYLVKFTNISQGDADSTTISVDDVEALAGDYTDDFADGSDAAWAYLQNKIPSDFTINNFSAIPAQDARDVVRLIRRAYNTLAKESDTRGVSKVGLLLAFFPSLMPDLVAYLVKLVGAGAEAEVAALLDKLRVSANLNSWQKSWLAYGYRCLFLKQSESDEHASRIEWLKSMFYSSDEPLRSHAFSALLGGKAWTEAEAMVEVQKCDSSMQMTYLTAIRAAFVGSDRNVVLKTPMEALVQTSAFHRALLSQ